jgi:hypothetical protein
MASRKDPVARARGRKPAPVKKPFPWGFAAGALTLALFLGGILTYAALNVSLGDHSSLKWAQHQISGLHNDGGLSRNHVDGKFIDYPNQDTTPPDGGNHNPNWQSCQVYTTPIANEHAVHSLEHGAVWVTYNPDQIKGDDLAKLKKDVGSDPYRILSPYPGLKSPISLQAWGEQLFVKKVSDKRIKKFMDLFTQGPQTQEKGASCVNYTGDRTAADAAFKGHASASGKPEGAANPGSSPMPAAPSATVTTGPTPTPTPAK